MARKKIFDGNGAKLKKGGTEVGGITKLTVPGWSKTEIDDTELGNVEVMTAVLGTLKKYNDPTMTVKFSNQAEATEGNAKWTIEFPGTGSLVIWMDLKSIGDASFENNTGVTADLTFQVTNLNEAGEVTKPVLTLGGE
ncbi:MAG: hypothetical protein HPZ91_19115 [Lentisphaeria bacterium]|nr:hypothetical protein [Lentisphaeria bacterium]